MYVTEICVKCHMLSKFTEGCFRLVWVFTYKKNWFKMLRNIQTFINEDVKNGDYCISQRRLNANVPNTITNKYII